MDVGTALVIVAAGLPAAVAAVFALRASNTAARVSAAVRVAATRSQDDPVSEGYRFYERLVSNRVPGTPVSTDSAIEHGANELLFNADLAIVLFNFSPDAIIVADDRGHIAQANRQAELLTGFPRSELHLIGVDDLLPADLRDRHTDHRTAYMDNPQLRPMGAHLDLRLRRKNGTEVAVDINLSPVATVRGMYVIATIRRRAAVGSVSGVVAGDAAGP